MKPTLKIASLFVLGCAVGCYWAARANSDLVRGARGDRSSESGASHGAGKALPARSIAWRPESAVTQLTGLEDGTADLASLDPKSIQDLIEADPISAIDILAKCPKPVIEQSRKWFTDLIARRQPWALVYFASSPFFGQLSEREKAIVIAGSLNWRSDLGANDLQAFYTNGIYECPDSSKKWISDLSKLSEILGKSQGSSGVIVDYYVYSSFDPAVEAFWPTRDSKSASDPRLESAEKARKVNRWFTNSAQFSKLLAIDERSDDPILRLSASRGVDIPGYGDRFRSKLAEEAGHFSAKNRNGWESAAASKGQGIVDLAAEGPEAFLEASASTNPFRQVFEGSIWSHWAASAPVEAAEAWTRRGGGKPPREIAAEFVRGSLRDPEVAGAWLATMDSGPERQELTRQVGRSMRLNGQEVAEGFAALEKTRGLQLTAEEKAVLFSAEER